MDSDMVHPRQNSVWFSADVSRCPNILSSSVAGCQYRALTLPHVIKTSCNWLAGMSPRPTVDSLLPRYTVPNTHVRTKLMKGEGFP